MADVDYDAPRTPAQSDTESLDFLKEQRAAAALSRSDLTDHDFSDAFALPAYDVLDEELAVTVVPMQGDEFLCGACFMVLHQGLAAGTRRGAPVCRDCA